jgi:hypothetical protein
MEPPREFSGDTGSADPFDRLARNMLTNAANATNLD